jgi:hypothetical protein
MSRFFRIQIDHEGLTNELFEYVTDPRATRNERPVIKEMNDINPDLVDILECMVLDGTEERQDIADLVVYVFGET